MNDVQATRRRFYRVWIARYDDWRPSEWSQSPPRAVAVEPAEEGCLSDVQATAYLEGFNRRMLGNPHPRPMWAIAVPVELRYEGDLQPGQVIDERQPRLNPARRR